MSLPDELRRTADDLLREGLISAGHLCRDAADDIEALRAGLGKANEQAEHFEREWYGNEIEALRRLLLECEAVATKIRGDTLYDAIDNHGSPYQSQWAADLVARARAALAQAKESDHSGRVDLQKQDAEAR